MMKFVFGMQINIEVFYKLILLFWVYVSSFAQVTQNKVCIYFQYLQTNMRDGVNFLSADKRKSFLQVDSITLGVCS